MLKAAKKKRVAHESSLTAIIEKQIDIVKGGSQIRKAKYKAKPAIKPSSIGCPCLRKIYYDYNRVEPDYPFPLKAKKILIVGDILGDMLAEMLRQAGVLVDYRNKSNGQIPKSRHTGLPDPEFPLKDPEFEISAKIDAVCIINDTLILGEFKTINAKGFDALTEPKDDHKLQAAIYAKRFGVALKRGDYDHIPELMPFKDVGPKETRVFYLKKDNTDFKEYVMSEEMIDTAWNEVVDKSTQIRNHTKNETLPETTWYFCDGCQFRDKCRAEYVVKKEDSTS